MSERTSVILINLGTPASVDFKAVRQFLKEFLMDPYVIQAPWLLRLLLVFGFVLPFRSKKTQKAYQAIWDKPQGSPLLYHGQQLVQKLAVYLEQYYPNQYTVHLGMRYAGGDLNLKSVLESRFKKSQKLMVVPLYPQYAASTTESSVQYCLKIASKIGRSLQIVPEFYNHTGFITALAEQIKTILAIKKPDYLLFSFHGLPQVHLKKVCQNSCKDTLCPPITSANHRCYRAHCVATLRAVVQALGLKPNTYGISFQSRLGRLAWIEPYTDEKIEALAKCGIRHLAVVCPSFVSDCLETKEEIQLRLRARWFALLKNQVGTDFSFIPCLNDHDKWVAGLAQIIHTNT